MSFKRQFCQVKHDPENGTYGDCLRACVATILGHDVPHFFEDGCNGEVGMSRLRDYLKTIDLVPVTFSIPSQVNKDELFQFMKEQNPSVTYLLFCKCDGEDHVVICREDTVLFNPAWAPYPISGPGSSDVWVIMAFAKCIM